jgi:uncharacterized protein (DUF302 family)
MTSREIQRRFQLMTDMNPNATPPDSSVAGVVTKLSPWSVADTIARLSAIVAAEGMKVFAVIDHGGEAEAAGLVLRDTTVVIFGSPETDTPLIQAAPLAALELPLKVLVWRDGEQTKVSYIAPGAHLARYQLDQALTSRLAGIDGITDAVIHG